MPSGWLVAALCAAAGDPRPASPMHGVNQWPALPGWRPVVERYLSAMFAAFSLVMRGSAAAGSSDRGCPYQQPGLEGAATNRAGSYVRD